MTAGCGISPVCAIARPSFRIKDHAIVHAAAFYASMFPHRLAYVGSGPNSAERKMIEMEFSENRSTHLWCPLIALTLNSLFGSFSYSDLSKRF